MTTVTAPQPISNTVRRRTAEPPMRLGERLFSAGLLTAEEIEAALNQQASRNTHFGETLLELGFIDEDTLVRFLGAQLHLPAVRLREGLVDPAVVRLIPRAKAEASDAIAMFKIRDVLVVALAEPENLRILDDLERITGLKIRPVLSLRSTIRTLLPRCYENNFAVDAVTADLAQDAVEIQTEAYDIDLQGICGEAGCGGQA